MSFYNYYLKGYFLTDVSEITELREKGIIGNKLKPGLLDGSIIAFTSKQIKGAVHVKVNGNVCAIRHVCDSGLTPEDAKLCAYNIAYTMYQNYPIQYIPEPFYSADEVCR